jgi:hypothetical protein
MGFAKKPRTARIKLTASWILTNTLCWAFWFTVMFTMALSALLFLAGMTKGLHGKQLNSHLGDAYVDPFTVLGTVENNSLNVSGCPGMPSFFQ